MKEIAFMGRYIFKELFKIAGTFQNTVPEIEVNGIIFLFFLLHYYDHCLLEVHVLLSSQEHFQCYHRSTHMESDFKSYSYNFAFEPNYYKQNIMV